MGVNPQAQAALDALFGAWGQPLPVISAYRDPAHNARVGGAKNSQHTHGNAFDIDVSSLSHEQRLQLAEKARAAGFSGFGFYDGSMHFDIGPARYWGPSYGADSTPDWAMPFVQTAFGQGAAGGGGGGVAMATSSGRTGGGQPPRQAGLLGEVERPRPSIWDAVGGRENIARLAMSLDGMTLNPNAGLQASMAGLIKEKQDAKARNKTIQWLRSQGRDDLAAAMEGGLDAGSAMKMALDKGGSGTALQQNVQWLMSQGMSMEEALRAVQGASGGTNIDLGGGVQVLKDLGGGSFLVSDPNDENGIRVVNLPGSKAAREIADEEQKARLRTELEEKYTHPAITAIDDMIGPVGQDAETGAPIDSMGGWLANDGWFDLPSAGNVGEFLTKLGPFSSQEATNVRNALRTVGGKIALDRLREMREAAANGASGLGALTKPELDLLLASMGDLDQTSDPTILRRNLHTIRTIMSKIMSDPEARATYENGFGAAPAAAPAPGQGGTGGFTIKAAR